MLYYQPIKKLQRLLQKLSIGRQLGIFFGVFLGVVLFSWMVMAQEPVVLTILLQGQDLANWTPFVKEFESKNPDIRVQMVEGPFDTNLIEGLYTSAFFIRRITLRCHQHGYRLGAKICGCWVGDGSHRQS